MLNGQGPEAGGDAGVVQERCCVLVDVATTAFLSNCIHFLAVWRRDLQSDAVVEAELLERGEKRWIVLDQSLDYGPYEFLLEYRVRSRQT